MFTRAFCLALCGLALGGVTYAQPAQTLMTGRNQIRSLYQNDINGAQRTLLTRENMFPKLGQLEAGSYFEHDEQVDNERDSLGVYGRYGLWENVTFEAGVPVVNSDFNEEDNTGLGDVDLKLDLLAFQDIFRYPFIIPHVDVSLPTGDEDDGLGTGESVITFGVSVGTVVYDQLTYVIDASYAFNGKTIGDESENLFMLSGSIVWDISDRFAVLTEGRVFEENDFDEMPYQLQGGMVYRLTENVQLGGYGGTYREDTDIENKFDLASVRLSVQF